MSEKLFEDLNILESCNIGAILGEHPFDYLAKSGRNESKDVRNLLEAAFNQYPDNEKDQLKKRLTTDNVVQCQSAMFELLLHYLLYKIGYKVIVHPNLQNESNKKPDFLVEGDNDVKFYLEAILVYNNYNADVTQRKEIKSLFYDINKKFHDVEDAKLWVSIVKQSNCTVSRKPLCNNISSMLDQLRAKNQSRVKWIWKEKEVKTGWEIELQLFKQSSKPKRFISCVYPQMASLINVCKCVKTAFKKKNNKYGKLEYPLVLAINVFSEHIDFVDEIEAFFGSRPLRNNETRTEYSTNNQLNSAWCWKQKPQYTGISAAWLFNGMTEWTLKNRHILYINPWSRINLNEQFLLCLPHVRQINEEIVYFEGNSIFEMLDLNWFWL